MLLKVWSVLFYFPYRVTSFSSSVLDDMLCYPDTAEWPSYPGRYDATRIRVWNPVRTRHFALGYGNFIFFQAMSIGSVSNFIKFLISGHVDRICEQLHQVFNLAPAMRLKSESNGDRTSNEELTLMDVRWLLMKMTFSFLD